MMTASFDTEKYVKLQKEGIMNAVKRHKKLYFELGGKLFDDHHASRVLPGFAPDTKIKMLSAIKDEAELIICVNSENIQNGRIRSDYFVYRRLYQANSSLPGIGIFCFWRCINTIQRTTQGS